MTTPYMFRYNEDTGMLEEQANRETHPGYKNDCSCFSCKGTRYNLRSIPTEFKGWPQRDLIEGNDFEVESYNCLHVKDADPNQRAIPIKRALQWDQLEKIGPPEKWLEMYQDYQELLSLADTTAWWKDQFEMQAKLRVHDKQKQRTFLNLLLKFLDDE